MKRRLLKIFSILLVLVLSNNLTVSAAVSKKVFISVVMTSPIDKSIDFDVNKNITVSFNSKIIKGVQYDKISLAKQDNTSIPVSLAIKTNSLYVTPKSKLDYNTQYTLTIPVNSVKDSKGNSLENNYIIQFTTVKEPVSGQTTTPLELKGKIKEIEACGNFSLVLMEDGTLVGWGDNSNGQLGDGTTVNRTKPYIIMKDVKQVSAGGTNAVFGGINGHILILKNDNSVWVSGCNDSGLLGDGTTIQRTTPVKIMDDVKMVTASTFHSAALKNDGTVWMWGEYILNDTGIDNFKIPTKILEDAKYIEFGTGSLLVIKNDNSLWGMGSNYKNQIGINANYDLNAQYKEPVKIMTDVKKVASGSYFAFAIRTDNSLWGWGENYSGQLGTGTSWTLSSKIMDNVKDVSAGAYHTLIVTNDGNLYTCGSNLYGQLGDGTRHNKSIPVLVGYNIKLVSAGNDHSLIVNNNNEIFAFGNNSKGQLGIERQSVDIPIKVMDDVTTVSGSKHILAIKKDGTLWGWGNNRYGQLGDGTNADSTEPVKIASGVKQVFSGDYNTFVIKNDNSLWACGINTDGQLGDGTWTNRSRLTFIMYDVKAVAANYGSTFILKLDGTLLACGDNQSSFLCDGTHIDRPEPIQIMSNVKQISVSMFNAMVIKSDGTLWAWGSSLKIEKGTDGYMHSVAVKVMDGVSAVACGFQRCVYVKDESIYLWEVNYFYNRKITDRAGFEKEVVKLGSYVKSAKAGYNNIAQMDYNGDVWEYTRPEGPLTNVKPVKTLENVKLIECNDKTRLAIKKDNTLWVWGNNEYGQMGTGDMGYKSVPVRIGFFTN